MSCIDYFYRLLSRKDYSAYELLKKGQEKGFELNEVTEALEQLQSKGYQSDTRLVENSIASSQGKYGKFAVKRKCREKGIDAEVFEQAWMAQSEDNEDGENGQLDDLKAKVMRKYKIDDFKDIDRKTKAKVFNYLQYRGFNPFEVLEQWQN